MRLVYTCTYYKVQTIYTVVHRPWWFASLFGHPRFNDNPLYILIILLIVQKSDSIVAAIHTNIGGQELTTNRRNW